MKIAKLLLFCVLSKFCLCGKTEEISKRIIFGREATPNQFPYYARLTYPYGNQTGSCGSSLISKQWIYSAAHCFLLDFTLTPFTKNKTWEPKIKYEVHMHTILLQGGKTTETRKLTKIIIHPEFILEYVDDSPSEDERRLENDVALGFLDKEFQYHDGVASITLPALKPMRKSGDRCKQGIIVGFGLTSIKASKLPEHLIYAKIRTQNRNQLKRPKPKPCTDTVFYSEVPTSSKEGRPYSGDSGGPFVCITNKLEQSSSHVLYGTMSTVDYNTEYKTFISVYESVDKHLDFILTHVKDARLLETKKSQGSRMLKAEPRSGGTSVALSFLLSLVVGLLIVQVN